MNMYSKFNQLSLITDRALKFNTTQHRLGNDIASTQHGLNFTVPAQCEPIIDQAIKKT